MKKLNNKGFTIVELVIVVAVIAILAAVLIPTISGLIKTAQTSADVTLVKNVNLILATERATEGKNVTMQDALDDALEGGYDVTKLSPTNSDNLILWDQDSDNFVLYANGKYNNAGTDIDVDNIIPSRLWNISETTEGSIHSVYYIGTETTVTVNGVGFDAGKSSVAKVEYKNTTGTPKNVVIRTNGASTTLTINAATDTVNHYGNVGMVDAVAIDMNCYNEYGTAAYVKVTAGKVVVKTGGEIAVAFVNNDSSANAVVTVDGGSVEQGYTLAADAGSSNVVLTHKSENEVEAIAQEAINEAKAKEAFAGVSIAKEGEETIFMTLADFRDSVNGGNSYAGYTVTLMNDIDLGGVEWTPIGTTEHPFSGVFDGQGYTISNLKVNSTSGYAGLFGYIKGDMSKCPEKTDLPENWDESSIAINETNYTAGVKELNIDGFKVESSGGKKFCGTIVGYAEYALLRDLTVSNGVVNNTDKSYAGGIVGGTSAGMAFENLTVSETVEVKAGDHSVGGIVGGTNNDASNHSSISGKEFLVIFSNCTNKANVSTTSSTGYAGGIVGHTNGGTTAVFVMNCYNRGEIKCQTLTGGIAGESDKVYMLFNCINYGKVWNDATSGDNFLGGISGRKTSGSLRIIACINNGEVAGFANTHKIAGIIGSASGTTIEACVNRGVITNTKANGLTYSITGGADNVRVANEATYTVDSSVSGEMTSITITGGAVTCTSIVIDNEAIEKVFLAIDNFNGTITGLAGKTLYISGANSTVTIPEDTAIEKVVVNGTNCTIINNGTVGTIRFEVAGNNSIENNGTISNSANDAFTISSTVNGANVTITNNGTIEASEQEGAFALYFGSGATCAVNNHGTITGNNFGKVTVSE